MNAIVLRDLVKTKMAAVTQVQKQGDGEISERDEFLLALCEAIVEHIQSSGLAVISSGSSAGSWPIT